MAVTILTSFRQETLPPNSGVLPISEQVQLLADTVINSGLTGLVCSPDEVEGLRRSFPQAFIVTPGVRLNSEEKGDQKRVADPVSALRRGASAIVVGRPICEALDAAQAAKSYYEEIQKV